MDLTHLFRACVKTIRIRNKTNSDKNRILKIKSRNDFLQKASDIKFQITQLRDLLVENRAAYLRFGYHLKTALQMTDMDRDIIDLESEKIILICNQYIRDLKEILMKISANFPEQFIQHKLGILDILSKYLESVFKIHREQKKNRIQHEMDTFRLLKLEKNEEDSFRGRKSVMTIKNYANEPTRKNESDKNKNILKKSKFLAMEEEQANKFALEDESLHKDDIQLLESENITLLSEMNSLSEEVERIEKNVVGIAKLQDIFTEKVIFKKFHSKLELTKTLNQRLLHKNMILNESET